MELIKLIRDDSMMLVINNSIHIKLNMKTNIV